MRTNAWVGAGRRAMWWLAGTAALLVPMAARTAESEVPVSDEPLYAAPTSVDRVGRILAAVEIDGRGPYRFIVDTGANRSAVSARLAGDMGLAPKTEAMLDVHGVTGAASVPSIQVRHLRAGDIVITEQTLPVLSDPVFADAQGILGVDRLQGARIEVDFANDTVVIRRSGGRRAPSGFLTVPARLRHGGLLLVAGRVGTVRTKVIIDTGADRSIGNLALLSALARRSRGANQSPSVVTGATPGSLTAITFTTPTISIGEAKLRNLPVTFGDLHVFTIWGLTEEPALVVGMDILGTLRKFIVDYPRSEFQLQTYGQDEPSLQMCNVSGRCGSRLPRT